MKFSKTITINAPAEKVWNILGPQFTQVGTWSRGVPRSSVNNSAAKVNNSPVGGRLCETNVGKISEEFTAYDEKNMTLSFKGVITSKIFTKVISTNAVTAIDENTSKVTLTPNIDLTTIGILMYPIIKMFTSKLLQEALLDLKYFAENDTPSPSKLAAMKK